MCSVPEFFQGEMVAVGKVCGRHGCSQQATTEPPYEVCSTHCINFKSVAGARCKYLCIQSGRTSCHHKKKEKCDVSSLCNRQYLTQMHPWSTLENLCLLGPLRRFRRLSRPALDRSFTRRPESLDPRMRVSRPSLLRRSQHLNEKKCSLWGTRIPEDAQVEAESLGLHHLGSAVFHWSQVSLNFF